MGGRRREYDSFVDGSAAGSHAPLAPPPRGQDALHLADIPTDLRQELRPEWMPWRDRLLRSAVRWRATRLSRRAPTLTMFVLSGTGEQQYAALCAAIPLGVKAVLLASLEVFLQALDEQVILLTAPAPPANLADLSQVTAPFASRYAKRTCSATQEVLVALDRGAAAHGCTKAEFTAAAVAWAAAVMAGGPLPPGLEQGPDGGP